MLIMEWQELGDAATVYIPLPRRGFAQKVGFGPSYWIFIDINSSILCLI
jgi:hypothetical protein